MSLAYIPWALLSIPGIDFLILKLYKTGYDQEGRVHLRLSTKNMARKWAKARPSLACWVWDGGQGAAIPCMLGMGWGCRLACCTIGGSAWPFHRHGQRPPLPRRAHAPDSVLDSSFGLLRRSTRLHLHQPR